MSFKIERILAAVLAVAALAVPAQAGSHSTATKGVVMSHLRAFGALDIDAILANYSADAALITPQRVYVGPDEIRSFYEAQIAEFSQPDISMETDTLVFEGDTAFLVWSGESPDNVYEYVAVTYVVEGNEIASVTYGALTSPK